MRTTTSGWMRTAAAAACALAVGACSGGGGGGGGVTPAPNTAPVAVAGAVEGAVTRGLVATLDGSGSSDADGDALAYLWTQVSGPDVTGGAGTLEGPTPSFVAPSQVATLEFDLTVDDGEDSSAPSRVVVNVFEDAGFAVFVDGDFAGTSDGSQGAPYTTIGQALEVASGSLEALDVYVKTRADGAAYDERAATLVVPGGTSLYGGYGPGWIRTDTGVAANRTAVLGAARAVQIAALPEDAWVSGFAITGSDSLDAAQDAAALWAYPASPGPGTLFVEDDDLEAGDVWAGNTAWSAGSSYGVFVTDAAAVVIRRSTIVAGRGGGGQTGQNGSAGAIAQGFQGGVGGHGGGGLFGGDGGSGATGCSSDWTGDCTRGGGPGGGGGTGLGDNGAPGGAPSPLAAADGADGVGGGGAGYGFEYTEGYPNPPWRPGFQPGIGLWGERGTHGSGGGGGGGGASSFWGYVGGAGGRGGHGGSGGAGGLGGGGGGASIGVWLEVGAATVAASAVTAGQGGSGASGGEGGPGGGGGSGEPGLSGDGGGWGAAGGGGGTGGKGGKGGAGGGGPSFGVVVASGTSATVGDCTVVSGNGGDGGSNTGIGDPDLMAGGTGGYSFAIYDLDLTDGASVTETANDLQFGSAGTGGTPEGNNQSTAGAVGARNY